MGSKSNAITQGHTARYVNSYERYAFLRGHNTAVAVLRGARKCYGVVSAVLRQSSSL